MIDRSIVPGRVDTAARSLLKEGMQDSDAAISDYESPPGKVVWFPSLYFYRGMLKEVWNANRHSVRDTYTDERWVESSRNIVRHLEGAGVAFRITGRGRLLELDGPCVFLSNHMSTLETFVFPWAARCRMPLTFVLKDSLVRYPVFGAVARSRNPVVVTRRNPREDLMAVLRDGEERLKAGISVVIFPQTTRTRGLDASQFNTIGVKLARRAGVPVVPVAVQSDAWRSDGWLVKDFGRIDPSRPVRMDFGAPLEITGNGKAENAAVVDFIAGRLREWGFPVEGA